MLHVDIEAMPDSHHQQALLWPGTAPKASRLPALGRFCQALMLMAVLMPSCLALADQAAPPPGARDGKRADPHGYDIAVIIDNRATAGKASAREEVKAITGMLDRHMFADHIIQLERPSLAVICDIFGGCPSEARQAWPSLIAQIAERRQSRLFVYYLGPARVEGRERQFLFEDGPARASPYAVGWLHKQLEKTGPKSTLVMIDASFAPRRLSCSNEDPALIDATMKTVQRNYAQVMAGRDLPRALAEISAALPAEIDHCDRFDLVAQDVERPLFTKFLLKGVVEGLADLPPFGNQDGVIELGELGAYAHDQVRRAVRFQWGRVQSVWQVGPGGRAIASVVGRDPTFKEKSPAPRPEPSEPPKPEVPKPEAPKPDPEPVDSPVTPEIHVCDQDQDGAACQAFCNDHPDDFRCPFFGVCVDEPVSSDCPCAADDPRPACAGAGNWCRWSGAELGPSAVLLIDTVGAAPAGLCAWANTDESDAGADVLWDVFAPIGWRLIRPLARPSVACVLSCQNRAAEVTAFLAEGSRGMLEPAGTAGTERAPAASSPAPSGQAPKAALASQVCEQSLPPYIALPRWMPGTLILSDLLGYFSGCDEPTGFRRFAQGMPPPIILLAAPPVPDPVYRPPPSFPLPPPVELPPVQAPEIAMPPFRPTVGQTRWLQSALTLGNHHPGPIDGVIGHQTETAIQSWRRERGAGTLIGDLTRTEFIEIVTEFGDLFDQVQPGAPIY